MNRESWRSRAGFAIAAMGSAVGLGSIVRFPYLVGEHGGLAFIIIYLISRLIMGIPMLIGEVTLGRATARNPYGAFSELGKGGFWRSGGAFIVFTAFIVSAFYSALAGWLCGYLVEAVSFKLQGLHTHELASGHFQNLLENPWWAVGYHFLFMFLSALVVYAGLRNGIERGCKVMMPLLLLTLVALMIKGVTMEGSSEGIAFLLTPDWSKITPAVVLMAMGQSFFGLSLGQGTMITYGSYLPKKSHYAVSCVLIALADIVVSALAALAVLTIVISSGGATEGGLGLLFKTLPVVFSTMTGGYFIAVVFFLLVALAALTSEISVLEPMVAYLVDERKWTRHRAVAAVALAAFLVGVPCALATSVLSGWTVGSMNILELFDFSATAILIPIGALLGALLVGWKWGVGNAMKELFLGEEGRYPAGKAYLSFCLKYVAPTLLLLVWVGQFFFTQE